MCLVVQAEKVVWQQTTILDFKTLPNIKLPETFDSLKLSLSHQNWKSEKPVLLVLVYRPHAASFGWKGSGVHLDQLIPKMFGKTVY